MKLLLNSFVKGLPWSYPAWVWKAKEASAIWVISRVSSWESPESQGSYVMALPGQLGVPMVHRQLGPHSCGSSRTEGSYVRKTSCIQGVPDVPRFARRPGVRQRFENYGWETHLQTSHPYLDLRWMLFVLARCIISLQ